METQTATGSEPESVGGAARNGARLVRVWDLPTRVFHWVLVLAFFTALATGDPDRYRDIHVFSGYVVLGLICFRIVWGFAGSRYARFKSFRFGPRAAIAYLSDLLARRADRYIGHNPPGSLAIYFKLALALLVCITGWFVLGVEESQGALRNLADRPSGALIRNVHETLAWLMFALVLVHIAGVAVESYAHRENLAKAMFTGKKLGAPEDGIASRHVLPAMAILVFVAGVAMWTLHWRLIDVPGLERLPYVGTRLPDNRLWRDSCGGCHVPYHPGLLPARSWSAILDRPDDHFGLQWDFDKPTLAEIRAFLVSNSADSGNTEASYKIDKSISADKTPRRITETPYWIEKHGRISAKTWEDSAVGSKSNCIACHRDAAYGTFEDAAIRLPRTGRRK